MELGSPDEPGAAVQQRSGEVPRILFIRWWGLIAGFVLAIVAGLAIGMYMDDTPAWTRGAIWERVLLLEIHATKLPEILDKILLAIPWLGTNWTLGPLVIGASLYLWRRHNQTRTAVHLVTVLVGSSALNFTLKFFFDRPRPDLWPLRGQFAYASYPSGHAIASVAVLFTIAWLVHRWRGAHWPYYIATMILGVSLYSRLYLGVHWPTDVVAGYLMGTIWLAGTMLAFTDRRGVPAESGSGEAGDPVPKAVRKAQAEQH